MFQNKNQKHFLLIYLKENIICQKVEFTKSIVLIKNSFQVFNLPSNDNGLKFYPTNYVLKIVTSETNYCLWGFAGGEFPFWLLGKAFLREFYAVHDMNNDRIGFMPHDISYKKIITKAL